MTFVCGQCGRPVDDLVEGSERMYYDRTFALARNHLKVGYYQKCIDLITPLIEKYPADPRIHLILMASYTNGYTDLEMADGSRRKAAAECYDRLRRLRCSNKALTEYVRRRKALCLAEMKRQGNKAAGYWIAAGVAFLVALAVSGWLRTLGALVVTIFLVSRGCDNNTKSKQAYGWTGKKNPFC